MLLGGQRLTKTVDCIVAIVWSTSDKKCWLHYCYWVVNVWQKLLIALLLLGDQPLKKLLIALLLLGDQRLTKTADCIIAIGWSTSVKNCWLHYCYWEISVWKNCWLHYCYWVVNVWQKLFIALLVLGGQRLEYIFFFTTNRIFETGTV